MKIVKWLKKLWPKEDCIPEIDHYVVPVPPQLYNGKPVNQEFSDSSEDENGTELDGFLFYRIKCPTGITVNGTHYPKGAYWFNLTTFDAVEEIDAPFQG